MLSDSGACRELTPNRAPRIGLILLALALAPAAEIAHPAIGIVIDRQGAVFFSDTEHVWRVGPEGTKSIAVRDVDTHEL